MGTVSYMRKPKVEEVFEDAQDAQDGDDNTQFGDGDGIQIVIRLVSEEPEPVVEEKPPSRAGAFIFGGLLGFLLGG